MRGSALLCGSILPAPELDGFVFAARGEIAPVGAEGDRPDDEGVTRQAAQLAPGGYCDLEQPDSLQRTPLSSDT